MTAHVVSLVWLVAVWLALWEDVSPANLLSGIVVAGALLALFAPRSPRTRSRLRPVAAARFVGYFVRKLVESNALVAWEVVTPSNRVREAIVAVPISGTSDALVTLVANAISLTPGTLTLEVRREPTVLYVHVLHLRDVEAVRDDVLALELRAVRAFGSDEAIAAAEQRCRERGVRV